MCYTQQFRIVPLEGARHDTPRENRWPGETPHTRSDYVQDGVKLFTAAQGHHTCQRVILKKCATSHLTQLAFVHRDRTRLTMLFDARGKIIWNARVFLFMMETSMECVVHFVCVFLFFRNRVLFVVTCRVLFVFRNMNVLCVFTCLSRASSRLVSSSRLLSSSCSRHLAFSVSVKQ